MIFGVTYLDIVAIGDLCHSWAHGVVATFVAFGRSSVWSTLFRDQVSVLREVSIEHRPSTFAAFVHVVAGQKLLS